ncbi:MAG: response regulator [Myxococcota bacterium]
MPGPLLVIDAEDVSRLLLRMRLEGAGFEVREARTEAEAVAAWDASPPALTILDRTRPPKDVDFLAALRERLPDQPKLPVILQTSGHDEEQIDRAVRAGVSHYLAKPYRGPLLLSAVRAALEERTSRVELEELVRSNTVAIGLLEQATFSFRDLSEARMIGASVAKLAESPGQAVFGLTELLINAVEHGNLELGYDQKTRAIREGYWDREIDERLADPVLGARRARFHLRRRRDQLLFEIIDEGPGFDWRSFLDLDPSRAFDGHGRGIAMARTISLEGLEYRGEGNQVVAWVRARETVGTSPVVARASLVPARP